MIRAGIIGSTGYAGQELVRILLGHKDVEIKWYGSRSYIDQAYASVFQNMFQLVPDICKGEDLEQLCEEVDVVFTATPQGLCSSLVSENVLSKVKVIDLSADFRIKDVDTYEKWYGIKHQSPQFIKEAVYGLCGVDRGVPEVWGSVYDVRELLDSTVKLMDGKSPLEMKLPMPFEMLKKPLLRKIDKTIIGKLLRDHDVLKDWML